MGKIATVAISALPVRLAMLNTALTHPCVRSISTSMLQKYGKGAAITLIFCIGIYLCSGCRDAQERISYAMQTGKTNLNTVQLRILG